MLPGARSGRGRTLGGYAPGWTATCQLWGPGPEALSLLTASDTVRSPRSILSYCEPLCSQGFNACAEEGAVS